MTLTAILQNAGTCANAIGKASDKALQNTALGTASPRAKRRAVALGAATLVLASGGAPARASVAPPPNKHHTLPKVPGAWTETEVYAPTRAGKIRRRKSGGGDRSGGAPGDGFGDENHSGDENWDLGGGDDDGRGDDRRDEGAFGGGGDGDGGASGGSGGSGGSGDGSGGDDSSSSGAPESSDGGNLLWAWHTACGVAFAGSVQHATRRLGAGGAAAAAASAPAAQAARAPPRLDLVAGAGAGGAEAVAASRARLCLASVTTAHIARQPRLCMKATGR